MTKREAEKLKTAEEYKREWRNYLSRIYRAQKAGYSGYERIKRVPNPIKRDIAKLKAETGAKIRAKSKPTYAQTGEVITSEQKRAEEKQRRSEASKRGWETRRRNIEQEYQAFENAYLPREEPITIKNILDVTVKRQTSKEFYDRLMNLLREAPSTEGFEYFRNRRIKYEKYEAHKNNLNVIENKLAQIIADGGEQTLFYRLQSLNRLDNLVSSIEAALFAYEWKDIDAGYTETLALLNGGILRPQDYSTLLNETDGEQ